MDTIFLANSHSIEVSVIVQKKNIPTIEDIPTWVGVEIEGYPIDAWGLPGQATKECEKMRVLLSADEAQKVAQLLLAAAVDLAKPQS